MQYAYKIIIISSFKGQLFLDKLNINQRRYYNLPELHMESQLKNLELRINPFSSNNEAPFVIAHFIADVICTNVNMIFSKY